MASGRHISGFTLPVCQGIDAANDGINQLPELTGRALLQELAEAF